MTSPKDTRGIAITAIIALAVGVASYALFRSDPWGDRGSGLPSSFALDLDRLIEVDPNLIGYQQTAEFALPTSAVRALAVGPENRIYVAGERAVHVLAADGQEQSVLAIKEEPSCLAVAGAEHAVPGQLYVGAGGRVYLFDAKGEAAGTWDAFDKGAILTSIAVAPQDVFVADAGNRLVLRCDQTGKIVGRIGASDPGRSMPGFIVPSPYFDIVLGADELLHVVDPGRRRITAYTFDGELQSFWGKASPAITDFFGCCNPSHIATLPDGRFVTSEKGIPRVKVYSEAGDLDCVVAGPEQLGISRAEIGDPRTKEMPCVFDIATDTQGRVLVLDPRRKSVRVFRTLSTKDAGTRGHGDAER